MSESQPENTSGETIPPRSRKKQRQPRKPKLTYEKYSEMYMVWSETLSCAAVSARCGVSENTARKYVENGYPRYGFEPFRLRYKREKEAENRKTERSVAQIKAENLRFLKVLKDWQQGAFAELVKSKPGKRPEKDDYSIKHVNRIMKLEHLFIGVDAEDKGGADIDPTNPDTWTAEQLLEFERMGKLPGEDD